MKNLPIKNQMNTVFVHVTDLKAAAKWYGDLLGIEVDLNKVTSPVFNVPVTGTTSLTLDDHASDPAFRHDVSSNPIFNLYAPHIEEAYEYVKDKGIEIVREIEWAGIPPGLTLKILMEMS
jgi:catechol 2,3-dioxygenase-like lactoylglutathione lyase family enzyme